VKASEARDLLRMVIGERPVMYAGKCRLCGEPSRRSLYCHACSWAYGDVEYERGRPHGLDGRNAGTPTGGDVTCQ